MRSLAIKLTLAFLLIAVTGTLLVALFVGQRTQSEFDQFVYDRYQADLLAELSQYYQENNGWRGIAAIVVRGRHPGYVTPAPITLLNADRTVIYSRDYPEGRWLPPGVTRRAVAVEQGGETVGWVLFSRPETPNLSANSPEADFLERMRRAIFLGSLGAVMVALLLGIFLARTLTRPLRELTEAVRALAGGALGAQVPVRSTDELGKLTHAFNQMSADLARSVQQRRQMTADIAHDLRTPLSVILGYTEALSDGKIPGSPDVYEVMHGETQHLQRLIEDLRLLSLADAGELSLNRQDINPHVLLERTAAAHTVNAQEKGVTLQVDPPTDLPTVSADPERLSQVLGNLVANAVRHTPEGGRITLSATRAAGEMHLHVQDTGEGIPPEELPHIFDRFYRGNAARSQAEGESGLGLAIARSLVHAHGGELTVHSTVGKGARFTIALPIGWDADSADAEESE